MHIGVNTLFLIPSEVGGTEVILIETLKAILNQDPGLRVTIFSNRENHSYFERLSANSKFVNVFPIRLNATNRFARIIKEQIELPTAVRKSGIDVLWSPGYTGPIFTSIPHVVSIPDVQYESHPEDLSLLARWVTHILVKAIAKRAHAIVTLSEFSKSEILKYYQVPPDRIAVGYCGVDQNFLNPTKSKKLPSKLDMLIEKNKPYLLCVANSYPHKNLATLVSAFRKLEHQIPHSLVLIGQPRRGESELMNEVDRLQNVGRVIRLYFLPHEDLPWIYKCADLFVFPSLYEGFGLPILEAMAAGTPVIASRHASIPEIGGATITYVDVTNPDELSKAISGQLRDQSVSQNRMKEAMQNRAATFQWHKTAGFVLSALKRVALN